MTIRTVLLTAIAIIAFAEDSLALPGRFHDCLVPKIVIGNDGSRDLLVHFSCRLFADVLKR